MRPHRLLLPLSLLLATAIGPLAAASPVNINAADAATIVEALDGVGLAKARAIVAWRETHGPYKALDDLGQVKGIGPSILQRNHDVIQFGPPGGRSTTGARTAPRSRRKGSP